MLTLGTAGARPLVEHRRDRNGSASSRWAIFSVVRRVAALRTLSGVMFGCVTLLLLITRGKHDPAFMFVLVTIGMAIPSGIVLHDPAALSSLASPTTFRAQTMMRLTWLVVVSGIGWIVAMMLAAQVIEAPISTSVFTLHFVVLVLLASVSATVATRRRVGVAPGVAGATTCFGCVVILQVFGHFYPEMPSVGSSQSLWMWWSMLAMLATALLATTRDHAAPRLTTTLRRGRRRGSEDR